MILWFFEFVFMQHINKYDQQGTNSKADQMRSSIMENSAALEATLRNSNNNAQNNNSSNCVVSSLHRAFMPYTQASANHKQLGFHHQLSSSIADMAGVGNNPSGNLLVDDSDMLSNLWPSHQHHSHHSSGEFRSIKCVFKFLLID